MVIWWQPKSPPHNKWPPLPHNAIYKHCYKKPGKSRTCLSKLSETCSMRGNAMQPCSQDMKSVQFLDYHLLDRQAIMLIQLLHTALNTPRSWVFCSLCPTLSVFVIIYILILIHTIYHLYGCVSK
jgi:hypothetical protein